jgi:hypothetical protein
MRSVTWMLRNSGRAWGVSAMSVSLKPGGTALGQVRNRVTAMKLEEFIALQQAFGSLAAARVGSGQDGVNIN